MDSWVVINSSHGIKSFDTELISEMDSFSIPNDVYMASCFETANCNEVALTERPKSLPPGMWERHRAVITGLYVEKGMILRDIKAFMAEYYDFEAR